MKLKSERHGSVVVMGMKGKVMGGPDATVFRDELKNHLDDGIRKVVIDLGRVDWMNSSGLGILIGGLTTVKNAGGEMKLARTTDKIQSLLMITKLVQVFSTYETVEAAIAAFSE
ncbi:MAG TPA: anti-sigma factor antagonist [Bacteroidetes bacterium]|nr:anti-sigma-B factor antagonist [bacterium BMS3Bbin04]HDO64428.1 anti-sigma factor antagonist [Bacteroidota bacterium]HEX03553.1 anti-sigma factor antagonist [Bacteroidota bacterium]